MQKHILPFPSDNVLVLSGEVYNKLTEAFAKPKQNSAQQQRWNRFGEEWSQKSSH